MIMFVISFERRDEGNLSIAQKIDYLMLSIQFIILITGWTKHYKAQLMKGQVSR